MDLSVEIDRGDVWYDFPFDADGRAPAAAARALPQLTLFVKWRGERVPLVRWRTTVGGWRSELAARRAGVLPLQGLGRRARASGATSWPRRSGSRRRRRRSAAMVKEKRVNGTYVRVTNYDETGPGFLSAYGTGRGDPRGDAAGARRRRATSTTASAPTARSITRRCAGASRTAVTASTTSWRCACSASCSRTAARARRWARSRSAYRRAF